MEYFTLFYLFCLFLGISNVKCIRINTDAEGIPQVFYKYNNTKPGWYPKPIEIKSEEDMKFLFKHNDPTFGDVLQDNPGVDMNTRQTWYYDVTYANGASVTIHVKCTSLPIANAEELIDLNKLTHQVFSKKIVDDKARELILNNIIKLLNKRHLSSCISSWQEFFSKLPVTKDYHFNNTLLILVNSKIRAIQVMRS